MLGASLVGRLHLVWGRLVRPHLEQQVLVPSLVSTTYMALFPNWMTMHSGMGGGAVGRPAGASHWVGVWLVQERISAVSFLGQGGSSVMMTSAKGLRALGHWNF